MLKRFILIRAAPGGDRHRGERPGDDLSRRHAERADSGAGGMASDPPLSAAGRARAESLAAMLKDTKLTAIFTTEFKRTQETAAPVAAAQHVTATDREGRSDRRARREAQSGEGRRPGRRSLQHRARRDDRARREASSHDRRHRVRQPVHRHPWRQTDDGEAAVQVAGRSALGARRQRSALGARDSGGRVRQVRIRSFHGARECQSAGSPEPDVRAPSPERRTPSPEPRAP